MSLKSTFSLLNADYVQLDNRWNYKNVVSPFYRLYLIDDGEAELSNLDAIVRLEKGYLYLIPSFTFFNQVCISYLSQYYIHIIEESENGNSLFGANRKLMKVNATATDLECFKRIIEINPGRDLRQSNNPKVYEKTNIIKSFKDFNDKLPLSIIFETQGILLQLLSRFLEQHNFNDTSNKNIPSKILDAINYIEINLTSNLSVEYLAQRANQSTDHFSRLFFENTGIRPLTYIHIKRTERAQFLILSSGLPLSIIAADTGFESLSYFNRIFKRITGKTPSGYKSFHNNWM